MLSDYNLKVVKLSEMINIFRATKKSTKAFCEKEWRKVDLAHWGKHVEWKEKKFRFKAIEEGVLVGLISGKLEAGTLYIGQIITAEKVRGKGIGTMLIKKVEDYGKKFGAHKIWLLTGKDWSENEFYKKLGFKIEATLPNHHYHKDFVIYSKPIK